jgi:tRNA-Thr(GGU) m(6)t(6)A37 methyltransferase TsaA
MLLEDTKTLSIQKNRPVGDRAMTEEEFRSFTVRPVGVARSPFKEKFGIPRQAGLVAEAVGRIDLIPPYDDPAMVEGLDAFSHIWLTFVFHRCLEQGWRKRVRPPRLGGNVYRGVYASRSPFRPNHVGLSAVALLEVRTRPAVQLVVGGLDLLDGTPVVDLRPYLPYADALPGAVGGFADTPPEPSLEVVFSPRASAALAGQPKLAALIRSVLALDPRPAYRAGEQDGDYGVRLAGVDVRFRVDATTATVVAVLDQAG